MSDPRLREITLTDIESWGPCYSQEKVEALWPEGRVSVTPLEIADATHLTVEDRLWLLLRPQVMPHSTLADLVGELGERSLLRRREADREPHADSRRAVMVTPAYLRGEATLEDPHKAAAVAYSAVGAYAAGGGAEREWQLARVRKVLEELETGAE